MKKKELAKYLLYFSDNDNIVLSDGTNFYDITHTEAKSYQAVLYFKGENDEDKKGVREQ